MIKDIRDYIFDVGDVVIGRDNVIDLHDEIYSTPQRVKKKEDVEEIVVGKKPYKIIYQVLWFENNHSMFSASLFKPFDNATIENCKSRALSKSPSASRTVISTKPSNKGAQLKLTLDSNYPYKVNDELSFSYNPILYLSDNKIKCKPNYIKLINLVKTEYSLSKLRAIELTLSDKHINYVDGTIGKLLFVRGMSNDILTFVILTIVGNLIIPSFLLHGTETTTLNPYLEFKPVVKLNVETVEKIISTVIEKNLFMLK